MKRDIITEFGVEEKKIDVMENQIHQEDEELEKEIEQYTLNCHDALEGQQGQCWEFDWDDISMTIEEAAHHFAQWQKEKDRKWIAENHKQIFNNGYDEGFEAGRDDAFSEIEKVPASKDLEEAAKFCVADTFMITNEEGWNDAAIDAMNIFKMGAKWQEKQTITDACELLRANLCEYFDASREDYDNFIDDFRKVMGD